MFNPYVGGETIRPVPEAEPCGKGGALDGILSRLKTIDSDDLLLLLLVYLLVKEGDSDGIWPLVAAALYLIL